MTSDELLTLHLSRSACEILFRNAPSIEHMQKHIETLAEEQPEYAAFLVAGMSLRLQLEEALA